MSTLFAVMAVGPFFMFCTMVLYRLVSLGHGCGGDLLQEDFTRALYLGVTPTVCGTVGLFLVN
jgi:hypothetical protein